MASPAATATIRKSQDGSFYADPNTFPNGLDGPDAAILLRFTGDDSASSSQSGEHTITYPVFAQGAGTYGKYSEYMRHHGCACCSLTTVLAAFTPAREDLPNSGVSGSALADLTPDRTIEEIERRILAEPVWEENYSRSMAKQSPVTLHGISQILAHFGISNRYVPTFRRQKACRDIAAHLATGNPVIVETSRLRYWHGVPVSISDRKFAGSYHTTILIGIEPDGNTVWMTDSADRAWAGSMQRLKRVSLKDLMNYMFPCAGNSEPPLYYSGRSTAGGFILIG